MRKPAQGWNEQASALPLWKLCRMHSHAFSRQQRCLIWERLQEVLFYLLLNAKQWLTQGGCSWPLAEWIKEEQKLAPLQMEWKAVETVEEQEVGCMESSCRTGPIRVWGWWWWWWRGWRWAEEEPAIQMTELKEAWVSSSSNQLPLVSKPSPIVGAMGLQEESLERDISWSWVSGRVLVVNDFIPPGRSLGSIKALWAGSWLQISRSDKSRQWGQDPAKEVGVPGKVLLWTECLCPPLVHRQKSCSPVWWHLEVGSLGGKLGWGEVMRVGLPWWK